MHNRPRNGEHIGCAIVTQADQCSRRKVPVGGVDDRTADGKWNSMGGGDPARNMGFHVNGHCAYSIVKSALIRGIRNRCIRPGNFRVYCSGKRLEQSTCPSLIRRMAFLLGPYTRSNHPVSGNEMRR
jgi:hypothetical protein